ncbi:MAG: SGNH/GDSL hydrolase family protein, partial [Eubacteriales bacterium]|nr:SGNH/GDSL hydrolase family protein [Eubacteriales bacterium]
TPTPTTKPTTKSTTTKVTTEPKPTTIATTTLPPKSYVGLLWYAIGDSITNSGLYPDRLVRNMGLRYYYNDGIAGTKMATMADRVTASKLATFDLVTVFAGTNDYGEGTLLGTINDLATTESFYGHVQKVIDKIKVANPNTELVFLTPIVRGEYAHQPVHPAANDAGFTLPQYVQAIKDVCSKNSVKVIDLYKTSGITLDNLSLYTQDNLHPNWDGAELIAQAIQRGLER